MEKQQHQQTTPDPATPHEAVTPQETISDSLDKTEDRQAQKEKLQLRFQTGLSVLSFLFAIVSTVVSTHIAITQFSESGPQFSYVAQVSEPTGWTEYYNDSTTRHRKGNSASILLSNIGRMKTTVLSVSVEDSKGDQYANLCGHQEVTIEPGETKLVIARFSELHLPIGKVHVLTGDAQIIEARKQKLPESDAAVQEAIDFAFRQKSKPKSSGQEDKGSDESTSIDPDNDIVCLVDPDQGKRK